MPQPELPKELNQALELEKLIKELQTIQRLSPDSLIKGEFESTINSLIKTVTKCKDIVVNLGEKDSIELNKELDVVLKGLSDALSETSSDNNE